MTTQHTPTHRELYIDDDGYIAAGHGDEYTTIAEILPKDGGDYAAFIVKAVNSHDDLIAALKDCMDNYVTVVANCTDTDATDCGVYRAWERVLARARGEA